MPLTFWIKRFLVVYVGIFLGLFMVALLRDRTLARAATDSALWAGISATIFVGARWYHSRKGRSCALCRDTPEVRPGDSDQSEQ
jgi:hypothetical protein